MRRFLSRFAIVFFSALAIFSSTPTAVETPPPIPHVGYTVYYRPGHTPIKGWTISQSLSVMPFLWEERIHARFGDDVFVITGHGGTIGRTWVVVPDNGIPIPVEGLVAIARSSHPSAVIVLLICNPDHIPLNPDKNPGVAYSTKSVWVDPDHFWALDTYERKLYSIDATGDLWDFVFTSGVVGRNLRGHETP